MYKLGVISLSAIWMFVISFFIGCVVYDVKTQPKHVLVCPNGMTAVHSLFSDTICAVVPTVEEVK